jgi:very-short-patch-repair endonuclease
MKIKEYIINGVRIKTRPFLRMPQRRRLLGYSRENRKSGNLAEVVFWKQVHKGKFHGIDFTRQFVIGNYIADFCVRRLGLVVEVDGGYHIGREAYDAQRDAYMQSLGYHIFRVSDQDVLHNTKQVMRNLERFIVDRFGEPEGQACIFGEFIAIRTTVNGQKSIDWKSPPAVSLKRVLTAGVMHCG